MNFVDVCVVCVHGFYGTCIVTTEVPLPMLCKWHLVFFSFVDSIFLPWLLLICRASLFCVCGLYWFIYLDFFFSMWFVAYSSCEWCVWWNICGFSLKVSIKHQLIIHHFIENGRKSRSSAFNHNCTHASQFGSIQTLFFNSPKKYRTKAITFFVCASSEMSVCVINFCSLFFWWEILRQNKL